ncbi:MAG: PhoH family protein [Bacteroidetes bacterium]|nr:PhoH family protein [Bacteroidota bacterium]
MGSKKLLAVKSSTKLKDHTKIFVIDTSVILYDSSAITHFQEHNIVIPIHVLEELDQFKKGKETRNREAREFIRFIDSVSKDRMINEWVPLDGPFKGKFKVEMKEPHLEINAEEIFDDNKKDHKILNMALALQERYKENKVILVSKDINLRLKAKSLNLHAEDYETGKIKDVKHLYTGKTEIGKAPVALMEELLSKGTTKPDSISKSFKIKGLDDGKIPSNHFFYLKKGKQKAMAIFKEDDGKLHRIKKQKVYGINPRNDEQIMAIQALMDPSIQLVTLQGIAGTGKTLVSLASALEQRRNYRQIFVACPIIPLSNHDIGYLPGDINSKLDPYMQPIWDNLNLIKEQFTQNDKEQSRIDEMVANEKISIAPLAYIRGRSIPRVFFIVDEAQNLTPHEIKTIISRAGEGTKMVFLGDICQIDTPYLDSRSNGLSYLIDSIKGNPLFAHITLEKGERSELANLANELL